MTHRNLRCTLFAVVALGLLTIGSASLASERIAKHENRVCTSCHDKPGSKLLTDRGKYYEFAGSLEGFAAVEASFERCTYCHVRKPGSKKLTKKGEMFSFLVGDMEGLLEWVETVHPGWPDGLIEKAEKGSEKRQQDKGN